MNLFHKKWPRFFMLAVAVQAAICLAGEVYVFVKFQSSLTTGDNAGKQTSQYKTIPTFLTLFIFGFVYELVVTFDALRLKSTIQIIGVCVANLAIMVFLALQIDQIKAALYILGTFQSLNASADSVWNAIRGVLIAIPVVVAVGTLAMALLAWKLYKEFSWDILKTIGADYGLTKRYLHYQIYIALLKFDLFFFLGFTVQFLVIVIDTSDPEFAITLAIVPITIAILLLASCFAQRENRPGMIIVIFTYFLALTYFIFKLVRIYQPGYSQSYIAVRRSLTAFAIITIVLIICTILNAIVCMRNFGHGLKPYLGPASRRRRDEEKLDAHSVSLRDVQPHVPSRMTIE